MEKSINEKEQCVQTDVKCRFFAQYFGQRFLRTFYNNTTKPKKQEFTINATNLEWIDKVVIDFETVKKVEDKVLLKSLESIQDKECCEIFDFLYPNAINYSVVEKIVEVKQLIKNNFSEDVFQTKDFVFMTDYFRSKGYALPYMGYSVEKLFSFGWVQLG